MGKLYDTIQKQDAAKRPKASLKRVVDRAVASGAPKIAAVAEKIRAIEAGGPLDRITFSAPVSERWGDRLEVYRKGAGLRSTSEAIRALLERGLGK